MKVVKDVNENLKTVERMIKRASNKKASIILFPEYCLYVLLEKRLMKKYTKLVKNIQKLAKDYHIYVIFSHAQCIGKKFYNVSFLISDKGKIIGKHKKIFIMPEEKACGILRGREIKAFKTKFGKIAIPICWDSFNDLSSILMRKFQKLGAEFVLIPSYSMKFSDLSIKYFRTGLTANCLWNYAYVACASNIGNAIGMKSFGHSLIISPVKGIIREGSENKEELLIADLDTKILKRLEKWDKKYYKTTEEAFKSIKKLILS